jgi:hypothetical protein
MYENYCFGCGSHVLIDEVTKLCDPCASALLAVRRSGQPERHGG